MAWMICLFLVKKQQVFLKVFLKEHWDDCIRIPMISESRSLNLSNSVAVIAYEAMRQLDYANLKQVGFDYLD